MCLVQILSDQTGYGKSNMAAPKPEIPISQLPGEIETKFQWQNLHFRGPAIELGLSCEKNLSGHMRVKSVVTAHL